MPVMGGGAVKGHPVIPGCPHQGGPAELCRITEDSRLRPSEGRRYTDCEGLYKVLGLSPSRRATSRESRVHPARPGTVREPPISARATRAACVGCSRAYSRATMSSSRSASDVRWASISSPVSRVNLGFSLRTTHASMSEAFKSEPSTFCRHASASCTVSS